ncbi:MAG: 4Fe-4S binding protein [Anaerolineales bacterium]|nr:4Fe-4S binding protein [Anaerolineales bacterium]
MYGMGILRGLGIVFKHFVDSYLDDLRWLGNRYYNPEALKVRQGPKAQGIFTVQYPEERLPTPEEFRFIPFLIYEEKDGKKEYRCTSCGICAKVCPPQCIWIERSNDPKTGRPIPDPKNFYIDIDICMNCGFCAEFCPFDAIKMDHDFELASYDRISAHIFDKERLGKPVSYYASIRPTNYAREEKARAEEEAKKAAKAAAKPAAEKAATGAAARPAPAAKAAPAEKKDDAPKSE